jgi:hypothetical protein
MERLILDKPEVDVGEKDGWENPDLLKDHQIEDVEEIKQQEEESLRQTRKDISKATYKGEPIKPYDSNPNYCPYLKEPYSSKPFGPRTGISDELFKKRQEELENQKELKNNKKFSIKNWFKKIMK